VVVVIDLLSLLRVRLVLVLLVVVVVVVLLLLLLMLLLMQLVSAIIPLSMRGHRVMTPRRMTVLRRVLCGQDGRERGQRLMRLMPFSVVHFRGGGDVLGLLMMMVVVVVANLRVLVYQFVDIHEIGGLPSWCWW
jgi:hypothetical protein